MNDSLLAGLYSQIPELILLATAILIVLLDAALKEDTRRSLGSLAITGCVISLLSSLYIGQAPLIAEKGMLVFGEMSMSDGVAVVGKWIILITLLLGLLLGYHGALKRHFSGEYYSLILFAAFGALVMANAAHLVTVILGLEILSLPLYTLAAFDYSRRKAREAGLKYLILGAFASGFLAVGCALYYAGAGTLGIHETVIPPGGRIFYQIGTALILAGLMFKGGMLPFFAWSPDAYEGAPDFAVGLMAALAKIGTFLLLLRFLPEILPGIAGSGITPALMLATAGTMLAGNVLALAQTNIKRMLAFSSVAHAGYMFLGLLAFRGGASSGMLFYLAGYAPVLVASFHIVALFPGDKGGHELKDYTGVGYRSPFLAIVFALMLISLSGLPPTPGFWGKIFMFVEAVQSGLTNLVILAMLASLVGVYYYLRVIVYMYMRLPAEDAIVSEPTTTAAGSLGILAFWIVMAIIVVLGIAPAHLLFLLEVACRNSIPLPL